MSGYSSLKVTELKEKLKERSLPTSGTKADLISRLEENDNAAGEDIQETDLVVVDDEPTPQAAPAPAPVAAPVATDTPAIALEPEASGVEGSGEQAAVEEVDHLKLVTEELDKRIKRAERFGLEGVEDLKKQRERAVKFGVDANQAREILGGGKNSSNGANDDRRHRGGHGRHRGSKRSNNDGSSSTTTSSAPIDDPERLAARKKRFVQEA